MGGALLQLVSYGSQDVYLIGNPQITLFKSVYKRHTNFSKEIHELSFKEQADFNKKISVVVERKGDLLSKCYLKLEIEETYIFFFNDMLHNNGYSFIEYVELVIGGHIIDKQYVNINIWIIIYLMKMKLLQRMIDPYIPRLIIMIQLPFIMHFSFVKIMMFITFSCFTISRSYYKCKI